MQPMIANAPAVYVPLAELEAGLAGLASPPDNGTLELIVCRPAEGERVLLDSAELTPAGGLRGDTWAVRGSSRTADGSSHPEMQITLANTGVMQLVAQERPLAAGRRSTVRRPGLERREPAAGPAPGHWRGCARNFKRLAHGLRPVHQALWQ